MSGKWLGGGEPAWLADFANFYTGIRGRGFLEFVLGYCSLEGQQKM